MRLPQNLWLIPALTNVLLEVTDSMVPHLTSPIISRCNSRKPSRVLSVLVGDSVFVTCSDVAKPIQTTENNVVCNKKI